MRRIIGVLVAGDEALNKAAFMTIRVGFYSASASRRRHWAAGLKRQTTVIWSSRLHRP